MDSSVYRTFCSGRSIHMVIIVNAPSLPINIRKIRISLLAACRSAVIPVDSPTVPKAETTSKSSCLISKEGSRRQSRKVPMRTAQRDSWVIRKAREVFSGEMLR